MKDVRLIRPREKKFFPPYVFYSGALSPPECDAINAVAECKQLGDGTIGNGDNHSFRQNLEYRTVKTCSLFPEDNLHWLFQRIRERVEWTNNEHFEFDLHGMLEDIVYLRYDTGDETRPPGHYDWHQDFGGGYSSLRKLSVIVQLSPPEEYDGCRLRLFTDQDFDPGHIGQGDMLIFPSWVPHCVTPITRGTRKALVSWIGGPRFR